MKPDDARDAFEGARRKRRDIAIRVLAHRLFHRAAHLGSPPDRKTSLRLADDRLVPEAAARKAAAAEARSLCLAALAERRPGGMLEGRVTTWVRTSIPRPDGSPRLVVIPTLVEPPGGRRVAVDFSAVANRWAVARLRTYRRAAEALHPPPVHGVLVSPRGLTPETSALLP